MTANPLSAIPPMTAPPSPQQQVATRFTPLDPLRVLRQYAKWLIAAGVVGLVVGLGIFFYLRTYAPEYTTNARLAVTVPPPSVYATADPDLSRADARKVSTFITNQIYILRSDETLSEAIKREDVRSTSWWRSFNGDSRAAIQYLQENLSAGQIPGSTLINVSMKIEGEEHKNDLPTIVGAIIQQYLNQYRVSAELQTSDVRRLFVQERQRMQDELDQIQNELRRFTQENDLPSLDKSSNEAVITYRQLANRMSNLQMAAQSARNRYAELREQDATNMGNYSPSEIAEAESVQAVASRDARLREMQEQMDLLLNRLGPEHRQVKQLQAQMDTVQQTRQREFENSLRELQQNKVLAAKRNLDAVENQLAQTTEQLEESRARMQDLTNKLEQYKAIGQRRETTLERLRKADELLNTARLRSLRPDSERVKLLLDPRPPELTFPKFGGVVFGSTMLALGVATSLVFVKELLDQRIKSPTDLRLIPDVEGLGVIPAASEDPSTPESIERVVMDDPSGLMAEAFRQVRTGILTRMDRRGYKTLLLVGAQKGCGASSITSNLAVSLAYNGRKVLLIDANFRRPHQHEIMELNPKPGLVEVLNSTATLDEAIQTRPEPDLSVLANGEGRDAQPELLEGAAFRNLLSQLESEYDVILIDAAPALVASEAQLLSKRVDAIALVVRAMAEKRGMISRMVRQLDGHRADILGVVLNGVRSSAGGYFRKNYEQYYRYRRDDLDGDQARKSKTKGKGGGKARRRSGDGENGQGGANGANGSDSRVAMTDSHPTPTESETGEADRS